MYRFGFLIQLVQCQKFIRFITCCILSLGQGYCGLNTGFVFAIISTLFWFIWSGSYGNCSCRRMFCGFLFLLCVKVVYFLFWLFFRRYHCIFHALVKLRVQSDFPAMSAPTTKAAIIAATATDHPHTAANASLPWLLPTTLFFYPSAEQTSCNVSPLHRSPVRSLVQHWASTHGIRFGEEYVWSMTREALRVLLFFFLPLCSWEREGVVLHSSSISVSTQPWDNAASPAQCQHSANNPWHCAHSTLCNFHVAGAQKICLK